MPGGERFGEEGVGGRGVVGDQRRDDPAGSDPRQHLAALLERPVEQVDAVGAQAVEEEGLQRRRVLDLIATEAAHRVLEPFGSLVVGEPDRLAVEDELGRGERHDEVDDLGEPRRDVVQVAGEDAHLGTRSVHLHARAVELPLDRRQPGRRERRGDVFRAAGEHRHHRPEHLEAHRLERLDASDERESRGDTEIAGPHRRPPHDVGRNRGRARDRVEHQPFERPDGAHR